MAAHKNISGKHPSLTKTFCRRFTGYVSNPSGEINRDGVDALITTLDRRISDLLDEIIHLCEFQQSAPYWRRVLH